MQFIIGVFMFAAGLLFIIKSEAMLRAFGRIYFFEKHLGTEGGTRLGYKLLGFLIVFLGFLSMTGMIGGFLNWVFSPLTRYSI